MTRTKEEEVAEKIASGRHDRVFTEDEFAALRDIAAVFLGFRQLGRVAALVQRIMKYIGWIVIGWIALKAGPDAWRGFMGMK